MATKHRVSLRPAIGGGSTKDNPTTTYLEKFLKLADQALGPKRLAKKVKAVAKQAK